MLRLEENTPPEIQIDEAALEAGSEHKQRRQMLVALALLLVALILVLVKDRDFWFPSSPTAESEQPEQPVAETATATPSEAPPAPAPPLAAPRTKTKQHVAAKAVPPQTSPSTFAPVVTNRAVLPPLEVEVVAGDEHRTIRPGSNAVSVDLQPKSSAQMASGGSAVPGTSAERVRLSPGTAEIVSRPVEPTYPLLAKQMKVQGAVVLQALIGREGNIQDLQVVSGPAILSAAAREAVKQWRFRPYLQAGQPVETEARITVNFTISTH